MQFLVLLLVIGCLSIANINGLDEELDEIIQIINDAMDDETLNPIDSKHHKLKLLYECLGPGIHSIVWNAEFDGQHVAVKIFTRELNMNREMKAYEALNATLDPRIENNGVPKVFYAGKIFNKYPAIVMSYFDDTLLRRWEKQRGFFKASSTLQVFLQSVRILQYLHSKGVLHNDIDSENIFLRGNKVFVGDFDRATLNGEQTEEGSSKFGSARFFSGQNRTAMDDLESLVYTIWQIADVHPIHQPNNIPAGKAMSRKTNDQKVAFVLEKCKHFQKFSRAYEACRYICVDEMLSDKPVPAYEEIINHLEAALTEVEQKTGQTGFEWLPSASSASSSSSTRV